jgi:hypothetical protein
VGTRLADQSRAVLPLALFLALFAWIFLRSMIEGGESVALGVIAIICGLMLFIEGVQHGLMPFSENIGYRLPGRSPMPLILLLACVIGVAATFAEPAIAALKALGGITDAARAPYLSAMLGEYSWALVLVVAASVGLAVTLGVLRMIYGWSLKSLIFVTLVPALLLTGYLALQPERASVLGLAWDCGGITTGPVTVPLVVALGIGVASAATEEDNPLSGFGIVTLASLVPAIGVMLLSLVITPPGATAAAVEVASPWPEPLPEIIAACRAILPLVALLWLIQRYVIREPLANAALIGYGIVLCVAGMSLFNIGLTEGLVPLGNHTGFLLPVAFVGFPGMEGSPLYPFWAGVAVVIAFGVALGYGATVAEPALGALGITVENLTDGAFRRRLLVRTVAVGVGAGTGLGVAKIVFDLPIAALLVPLYGVALILTLFSTEEYVNLAWDSAGVTTGPVTVPLVLAMGVGLGEAMHAREGFGILALASAGPIISVLVMGLWIRLRLVRSRTIAMGGTTG